MTPSAPEAFERVDGVLGRRDVAVDDDGNGDGARSRSRTALQSARPLKNWQRVRPCTVIILTPAASARWASSAALRLLSSQPSRIFSVTGTRTARTTASISDQGVIEIAHQRAARELAGHLARRAAHVDVDDVGAHPLDDARAFRHPVGFAADELNDERGKLAALARGA